MINSVRVTRQQLRFHDRRVKKHTRVTPAEAARQAMKAKKQAKEDRQSEIENQSKGNVDNGKD